MIRRLVVATALLAAVLPLSPARADHARPVTVVAVVDGGFTPYHWDTLGSKHPWFGTPDAIDFTADPSTYIEGYPGSTEMVTRLPSSTNMNSSTLNHFNSDAAVWAGFQGSTYDRSNGEGDINMYRFRNTKIIGAVSFSDGGGGSWYGDASQHGARSMASAAGNIHGTCPECLVVLISGRRDEAVAWATSQPWIDVVTNSYGANTVGQVVRDVLNNVPRDTSLVDPRDNIYLAGPITETRDATEDGQVITFSAGNGLANAFDVPMFTYWSGQKGPDWIVTVGAVTPVEKQTYTGSGKPVDISSIGVNYPSSAGGTAGGEGTHSGTSNASPVVGGYFAKTLQVAREALGDLTSGHASGVVASGSPVACEACPLVDGILTRGELQDAVFYSALPSQPTPAADTAMPTVGPAHIYQGHSALAGIVDGSAVYEAEWRAMAGILTGTAQAPSRPAGEPAWFTADSKCRQQLWGPWSGGYWSGGEPSFDPATDVSAIALDTWCSQLPANALESQDDPFGR